jgi:predicted site-specific integrase-resolvase
MAPRTLLQRTCAAAGRRHRREPLSAGAARQGAVTEVGSALNGKRTKFLALLRDPEISAIVVEHRERFARFGVGYIEAALSAQERMLVVVEEAELEDGLVRDMTELLTSFRARLYRRRAAKDKTAAVMSAIGTG